MAQLKSAVFYLGTKGEKTISTLFDDECRYSYIGSVIAEKICKPQLLGRKRKIESHNPKKTIAITHAVVLDFYIDSVLLSDEFFVLPGLGEEIVIGAPTIRKGRMKLNPETGRIEVNPKAANLQLI